MTAGSAAAQIYGHAVAAPVALDHLDPADGEPDIVARWGAVADLGDDARRHPAYGLPGRERYLMSWGGVLAAELRQGREVILEPAAGADPARCAHLFRGPVLAVALLQRGHLVLHATAVARGDRAVAVLGHSGAGKSTAAAALLAAGWSLVADDVVVLDADLRVLPGRRALRLYPAVAARLRLGCGAAEFDGKLGLPVPGLPGSARPRLSAALLLGEHDSPARALTVGEAIGALATHSYAPRAIPTLRPTEHLQHLGRLIADAAVMEIGARPLREAPEAAAALLLRVLAE